ncbi:hypothetical protein PR003_g14108 [Phytophthora rubi]|uniref:Uncharacterized protein n=1 Tax=Phytophthora rubi TaxID=129364 RepID=A0A6A4F4Z6_9STRA|nr:hypothetical protein PR001_g12861 [Phytophthora rubi]KAE9333265.1 hypothetical protein PR003_g14108 [Phytophthora rubi]
MVGLSASELQAETLFPGDTVEYYSMAFVAGDPRGHRVSKVLRIDRKDDEFPIRVDTQEMLPLTIMLKRKCDRNDVDISSDAKWRKLRTFRLVDGEVEGETRADRLNADLKKGLEDAMKATKKILAKEKAERVNAGSKKLMSSYFTSSTPADETRSRKYSFEKQATPERKKKKRKPLTLRENKDHSSSSRSHDKVELKKKHDGEKASLKSRLEGRPEQTFKYDKQETTKHSSLKRKRSGSISTQPKQRDAAPRTNQKTISKFFSARPKKSTILGKFIEHVEEIQVKKSTADLNGYLALENEQKEAVKTVTVKMKAAGGRQSAGESGPDRPNNASRNEWNERRTQFRSKQSSTGLRSWLTPLDRQKGGLEDTSSGTPEEAPRPKQRTLNLGREKSATYSPKMNRKTGLSFMNEGDASHRATEMKSSKHLGNQGSKRDNQPLKKRGSLDTVSARAPKKQDLMGQWNNRKNTKR